MARTEKSLSRALTRIPTLRAEFWENLNVPGENESLNVALEKAGRLADFLEFGELMCLDALERRESCGGHFREEFQYPDGEAKRDDERFPARRRVGIHRRLGKTNAACRTAGV
jgi:succinate dehydrogenase / fumarate reductase flavoprotein subunit